MLKWKFQLKVSFKKLVEAEKTTHLLQFTEPFLTFPFPISCLNTALDDDLHLWKIIKQRMYRNNRPFYVNMLCRQSFFAAPVKVRYRVHTQSLDGFKPARVWQASPIKNVQNKILGSVQVIVISDDQREKFLKRLFIRGLEHKVSWQKDLKLAWWKKSWKGRRWGEEEILHSMTSCFYPRLSVFLGKGIAKWHPVPPPLPQQIASQSPLC